MATDTMSQLIMMTMQRDDLLDACKALTVVVEERMSQLNGWYPEAWTGAQEALYAGETAIKACRSNTRT